MPEVGLLFVLNVDARGLAAEVRVNDVAVYSNAGAQSHFVEKINPVVQRGANTVTVSVAEPTAAPTPPAPARPPQPVSPSAKREFSLTVQRGQQGTDPGDSGTLLHYCWDPTTLLTSAPTEVFQGSFDAAAVSWAPIWEGLPLAEANAAELTQFVKDFTGLLAARQIEELVRLHVPKFRGRAVAFGLDLDDLVRSFRGYLSQLTSAPDWSVVPVNPASLVFRTQVGGRMVGIVSAAGAPPVMTRSAGNDVPFPMTLGRFGFDLKVVR